jgi:hypothetical protein
MADLTAVAKIVARELDARTALQQTAEQLGRLHLEALKMPTALETLAHSLKDYSPLTEVARSFRTFRNESDTHR